MTATQDLVANGTTGGSHRIMWLPVAAALLGVGWGANQFTPLLLVYHQALGLSTGTLERCSASTRSG
jgi:hypothetical protein